MMWMVFLLSLITVLLVFATVSLLRQRTVIAVWQQKTRSDYEQLATWMVRLDERAIQHQNLADKTAQLLDAQQAEHHQRRQQWDAHQIDTLKMLQDSLYTAMTSVRQQVTDALTHHGSLLTGQVEKLTQVTEQRLHDISGQVEKRLAEGFDKTTATFTEVVSRLAIIDAAQKKITELSNNVVSLQEILADKKSRGAFGEVQLIGLVRNMLPESSFALQHVLSNGKRVDCLLFLPEPTGNIGIDSKFPLESYRRLSDSRLPDGERKLIEQTFRRDIRTHIQDVANKYIIPGETADGVMLFIPAEAVFSEIHSHYSDLVEFAQRLRVWLVSPTTMMAILTTARAVLKDAATRQQVHIIQEHLVMLSKDFERFQTRMDKLNTHIRQAHEDVDAVNTSAQKISQRFSRIERVDMSLP